MEVEEKKEGGGEQKKEGELEGTVGEKPEEEDATRG